MADPSQSPPCCAAVAKASAEYVKEQAIIVQQLVNRLTTANYDTNGDGEIDTNDEPGFAETSVQDRTHIFHHFRKHVEAATLQTLTHLVNTVREDDPQCITCCPEIADAIAAAGAASLRRAVSTLVHKGTVLADLHEQFGDPDETTPTPTSTPLEDPSALAEIKAIFNLFITGLAKCKDPLTVQPDCNQLDLSGDCC